MRETAQTASKVRIPVTAVCSTRQRNCDCGNPGGGTDLGIGSLMIRAVKQF